MEFAILHFSKTANIKNKENYSQFIKCVRAKAIKWQKLK